MTNKKHCPDKSNNGAGQSASVSDKKGNGRRFQNQQRDALFFPEFLEVRNGRRMAVGEETSVTTTHTHTPFVPSLSSTLLPSSLKLRRFVSSHASPIDSHLIKARRPAKWRDLTAWMQAFYRHAAAYDLGPVYSFSLNISPDIEVKARAQVSTAVWLQKRIARELGRLLPDEAPTFWFVIEQVNRYRHLHLHGEIVTDNIAVGRKALRLAGGEWGQARQHQVKSEPSPDDGWIGYAFKDLPYSQNGMFAHLRNFAGEPYASTRNITQLAQSLYEADRQQVLAKA